MRLLRIPPRLILPLMIAFGAVAGAFHVGSAWQTLHSDALFAPPAFARDAEPPAPKQETSAEPAAAPPAAQADLEPAAGEGEDQSNTPLYKQLMGRREQLDKRQDALDSREALIRVAEERVDQKLKEMETLRTQLQSLLGQANAAGQAQLENLVKIYEIMKPKEAAKIFETLEMPILLGVVQKMKPARTAAVLAEMNPQKAKDITTALTRQNQLPQARP